MGAARAWSRRGDGWTGRRFHLGTNKEVFDTEAFAIYQALKVFEAEGGSGRNFTVFSDFQSAIRRALTDVPGPGQQWARSIIEVCTRLVGKGNEVTLRWVWPIRGGRQRQGGGRGPLAQRSDKAWGQTSLPHLLRRTAERWTREATQWVAPRAKISPSWWFGITP